MQKRVKALNDRREQLKAGIVTHSAKKRASLVRKNETTDKMKDTLNSLKVLQQSQVEVISKSWPRRGSARRNWRSSWSFARMVLPIVLGGIAAFMIYGINYFPTWGGMKKLMGFAAMVGLGYKGPEIYLSNLISKRTDAIRKGLPDALDLLVICAEAGLTVDASFNRVAKELGRAYPELGDEFALTAIELSFLGERRAGLRKPGLPRQSRAVKGVTTTMVQTERYGTPLASALRVLSAEFRNERMMRAEEKAARLPAIMTVPLILFILPVLFVVILGPAACSIADRRKEAKPNRRGVCRKTKGRSGNSLRPLSFRVRRALRFARSPQKWCDPHRHAFRSARHRHIARMGSPPHRSQSSRSCAVRQCTNSRALLHCTGALASHRDRGWKPCLNR
jgi:tight adherence protein C